MEIKQFEYKPLAHYSYAIVSKGKMAVIDPERDAGVYINYAAQNNLEITIIIQTHPHADFVSSHLELSKRTGACIYNATDLGATYDFKAFDEGDRITLGEVELLSRETPGHSPDSITIIAKSKDTTALFTGDTLFIGDVGRPDLREKAGNTTALRKELAEMMFHTITDKFTDLPDDALVYPAHGAGSLCGKNMSDAASSTLGLERAHNWAFNTSGKAEFIATILEGQPFIPAYFSYDVELNKNGAPDLLESIQSISKVKTPDLKDLIIDIRDEKIFKKGHFENSINIQAVSKNAKFETWLGSIVQPEERFTLVVEAIEDKEYILQRVSKIGYEALVDGVVVYDNNNDQSLSPILDIEHFKNHLTDYTIIDIRNTSETDAGLIFNNAMTIPLHELRSKSDAVPTDKPIVVHCAGGYRSAAGSSILSGLKENVVVYDLSDAVKQF